MKVMIGAILLMGVLMASALLLAPMLQAQAEPDFGAVVRGDNTCLKAKDKFLCIDASNGSIGNFVNPEVSLHFRYDTEDFAEVAICNKASHPDRIQDQACAIFGIGGPLACCDGANTVYILTGKQGPGRLLLRAGQTGSRIDIAAGGEETSNIRITVK